MSSPTTSAAERLHALDAVRGFALLLGIVLHATLSFVPAPTRFWVIQDTQPSTTLALLFFVIHVFRMTTFFVMAGFFAHMSFHRRGPRDFIADRLHRIGLPLLVGWPIIFAAMAAVTIWASAFPHGGPVSGSPWPPALPKFPLAHFWFLYVLLELYAATLLLRGGIVRLDRTGRFRAGVDRLIAHLMGSRLAPLLLALPIGVALSLDPKWIGWFGVRTPDQSFLTNAQALISYGVAFGFGWLLHRQIDLLGTLRTRWLSNLVAAVILIAISFVLTLVLSSPAARALPVSVGTIRLASAICYAPAIWTTTFAIIGLALRFLSGFSPARRYLADASYWLYLIHMPIVMALQVVVSQLDWAWPFKFAAILVVAIPVMLASYQWMVRYTFIGTVLNGRRLRREQPHAIAVAGPVAP
ncbi:acyltransferase family protein [Bradyrhizobium sp. UFLA05-112]